MSGGVTSVRSVTWYVVSAMTVLEETGPVMTSGLGGDRYITPEYLAPLPQVPTLHSKPWTRSLGHNFQEYFARM